MKKIFCLILLCLGALALCSCGSEDSVLLSDLGDYTIVYPAGYSEWKMTEVRLLQNVIKTVTGKEIAAVPDSEAASEKEIILGSSSRKTKYSAEIKGFDNAMCYVIGADGENIVLGGQNYYSDMRAIYNFVNHYLGYDDLADKYSEPTEKVAGKKSVLWEKPEYTIMGSMFSANPFQNASQVKDFADCNFNLAHIFTGCVMNTKGTYDNPAPVRDELKWCARFGIQAVIKPKINTSKTDPDYFEVLVSDTQETEQDIIDCPAVFGLYLIDEPSEENIRFYQNIVADVKEKYSALGWKFYVNIYTPWYPEISDADQNVFNNLIREYLSGCDAVSFDGYTHNMERRIVPYCDILQNVSGLAREIGGDFYYFIESYSMNSLRGVEGEKFLYDYTKGFRTNSYLGLCFGAKMVEYFQYGDASAQYPDDPQWQKGSLINADFTINKDFYKCAKAVNEEFLKVTDILTEYEFSGTYTYNPYDEAFVWLSDPYEHPEMFAQIRSDCRSSLVFGCYQNSKTGKKAVLVVNLDEFNGVSYEHEKFSEALALEFSPKDKVKCYREGSLFEMTDVGENTYSVPFGNGSCYLFTME